jgi:methylenetetrahydrofolate reductase (NADPH)
VDQFQPSAVARLVEGYSLEMTAKDVDALEQAAHLIPPGTSISVTYLPGDRLDSRVAAVKRVQALGFVPMPHFSARRMGSEEEFLEYLTLLECEVGIQKAFVVAGDPPVPQGPYEDALAVIRTGLLVRHGVRTVGISGYPEGHPQISDEKLWTALREKHDAIVAMGQQVEIITQFGFDPEPVLSWLDRVRDMGIEAPVKIGVPGPASVKTLIRFAARCGVGASSKVMSKYGISITQLLKSAGPNKLLAEFAEELDPSRYGEVVVHFYPFGGLARTADYAAGYLHAEYA